MKVSIGLTVSLILAVALAVAGTSLWVDKENERLHDAYLSERGADLRAALDIERDRVGQAVETLRQDTVFLALAPPVSGMVRASSNKKGIDPRDKDSYALWESRLQETFSALLRVRPDYFQIRLIGAAGEGAELVRVENRDGHVRVVPHDALQSKGDLDFFRAGLVLTAGRVQLSGFILNRESGKVEEPHRPALYAVTPVFDASGRLFGMVVINRGVGALLASFAADLPKGASGYVADQQGHYLFHPDAKRAYAFELGDKGFIMDDFPALKRMFEAQAPAYLPLQAVVDGKREYLAAERVFFDAGDPSRFLLLACQMPAADVAGQATQLPKAIVVSLLVFMFIAGASLVLLLRRVFLQLRQRGWPAPRK